MRKTLLIASAALLLAAGPAVAQQKPIKIGFVDVQRSGRRDRQRYAQ